MDQEKKIYTTNKWQEIVLAECCEDFGISLIKVDTEGKKTNWILTGHPVNLNGTLTGYFSNLKSGQPERLTAEEIDLEHKRRFPEKKEFKEMPASFYNTIKIDRKEWEDFYNSFVPPENINDFVVFQTKVPSKDDQLFIEIAWRTQFTKSTSNEFRKDSTRTRTFYFHTEDIPTLTNALSAEGTERAKSWIEKIETLAKSNNKVGSVEERIKNNVYAAEAFDMFRHFIADRAKATGPDQEREVFDAYNKKIANKEVNQLLQDYCNEVKIDKPGPLSFSNAKEISRLSKYLAAGYKLVTQEIWGDVQELVERSQTDQSQKLYKLEAESLLKGEYLIISELKESRTSYLREVLSERDAISVQQSRKLAELENAYGQLTKAHDTLINNVKKTFNVSEEKMREVRGLPKQNDSQQNNLGVGQSIK